MQAGREAQTEHSRRLLDSASVTDSPTPQVWQECHSLCSSTNQSDVIARFGVLPSDIARAMQWIGGVFSSKHSSWHAVIQATGLGWLRLDVDASSLDKGLRAVREQFERASGSFVLAHRPAFLYAFDAW